MAVQTNREPSTNVEPQTPRTSFPPHPLPKHKFPGQETDPTAAYQLVHDELLLDGNSRQNLATFCQTWLEPEIRKLMARLIGSVADYPMLLEVYRETYYLPRRLAFVRALERVQAAGLLAKDMDPETLADMLSGALMYHLLMPTTGENPVGEFRDHMIRLLRQTGFEVPP